MLRLLHIGCGSISDAWLSTITARKDLRICGLVDLNKEATLRKAAEYNLDCPVFIDVETALKEIHPDVVIDNIVPDGRLDLAELCFKYGAHVFSEKPLASSIESAKKIVKLSNEYNKNFFVMQNRRYSTNMFSFKNAIQSGKIGTVGYLGSDFFRDPHFGGFRDQMDSPLLIDMAIHTFDQARFLLQKDPVSVYCHEYNPTWSWYSGNSSAICVFEFEDGIVYHYTGSWSSPGRNTSWDSNWRAVGSKDSCLWNGTDFPECGHGSIQTINCSESSHSGCISEMIECIENNTRAQTDCRDNIKSLAMVFAAVKSSKENRIVYIKEILEV